LTDRCGNGAHRFARSTQSCRLHTALLRARRRTGLRTALLGSGLPGGALFGGHGNCGGRGNFIADFSRRGRSVLRSGVILAHDGGEI
jgi:hypothetical protein